jgi:hypothetical protein
MTLGLKNIDVCRDPRYTQVLDVDHIAAERG